MRFRFGWFAVCLCGAAALIACGCQRQDATAAQNMNKPVGLPPCCAGKAAVQAVDAAAAGGANDATAKASETPKASGEEAGASGEKTEKKPDDAAGKKTKLFDGKTLKGWKKTAFGGEGEVKVEDGMIVMDIGNDMTGVTWDGQPPATDNYELTLRAQRLDGDDFFCAATFPIGKEHCTLVLGGWGGTVVGISCVDGYDASDNTTTRSMTFKNKQWYDVRIRVSTKKLEAWIDGEQVVNLPRGDHKFSTRFECDPCRPLGFATWRTKGAVKEIEFRKLTADEVAEIEDE